jgi:hypothetical protein
MLARQTTCALQTVRGFPPTCRDNSVLTVAPPEVFGFLGPTPAPISVSGSTLEVPEGQTLSFIGGDLTVAPFLSSPPTLRALEAV